MAGYAGMVALSLCSAAVGAAGVWMWHRLAREARDRRVGELKTAVERLLSGAKRVRLNEGEDPQFNALARTANALLDKTEAELRQAKTEADVGRAVLRSTPNGVLLVGRDGRVRAMNEALRQMFDLREPLEGKTPIEGIPIAELQQAVEAGLQGREDEVPFTYDRSDLVLRTAVEPDGVMVLVEDVTRSRMAERARTEFVANVSHELRTPIATIMGYSETLLEDRDRLAPDTVMMAEAIHRNAHRLRDLFEDLLELSRIEARRRELPLQKLALAPLVAKAVTAAQDRAVQRKQKFLVEIPEELVAWANPEALGTIVGNLANNATNYTPEGGEIRVSAHRTPKEVVVEVRDNGIGIGRVHHQRIFERFYRVDEGRSRRVGGTGLGLAIVKHLAMASGCRLSLASEIGKGSVFMVHLPVERPEIGER